MCDGVPATGFGTADVGTMTPARGSSVRGWAKVSTSPTSGAAASRAVNGGKPQRVSTVLSIDVWSSGAVPVVRNTVPGAIRGETSTVGTRTPNRVKSNPNSPAQLSGATAPVGGATWS